MGKSPLTKQCRKEIHWEKNHLVVEKYVNDVEKNSMIGKSLRKFSFTKETQWYDKSFGKIYNYRFTQIYPSFNR